MYRTFKLIKAYPTSPEIGTVVEEIMSGICVGLNCEVDLLSIESYPEYWEEIKFDFNILELTDGYNTYTKSIENDNMYYIIPDKLQPLFKLVQDNSIKIKSVLIKNNEKFSLGDMIYNQSGKIIEIGSIYIVELNKLGIVAKGGNQMETYDNVLHIKRRVPLLVTEDGVEIFEGDSLVLVSKKTGKKYVRTKVFSNEWKGDNRFNIFATEETADIFINNTIQRFTNSDIIEFKEAVKSLKNLSKTAIYELIENQFKI
jgi:hypothetical protein